MIGGIKYALLIVDRKTRVKFCYGLKDLEDTTILRQLQQFVRRIGKFPLEMLADRDFKLIGGIVEKILMKIIPPPPVPQANGKTKTASQKQTGNTYAPLLATTLLNTIYP